MEELKERCEEYMDFIRSQNFHKDGLDDLKQYIFEAAMEHFFGKEVWKEINERMQ